MDTGDRPLTARELQHADGMADWRALGWGVVAWFGTSSLRSGAALARAVADAAGGRLPDLDLRPGGVRVQLRRPPEGYGPEELDRARTVSAAAARLGLRADPTTVQDVQLTMDALDHAAVVPFWQTVLGHEALGEEDLVDPGRRLPSVWFQEQDELRPLRNRLHLDVVTPQPVAVAALAAVRDLGARSVAEHGYYATVADAEGNEVDLLPLVEGADRWEDPGTEDWRLVFSAMACYLAPAGGPAVDLAEAVARLADEAGLPLGVDLRASADGEVVVTVDTGKDRWEMDEGYRPLAAQVQRAARDLGLRADVDRPRFVQVGIDAVDVPTVRRFWAAALGYVEDPRPEVTDLVDPRGLAIPFFLQPMEAGDTARRAQRNRVHVDVFVPDDQAQARIDAALRAGGRVVRDAEAPFGTTIADPEGNEVDIAVEVGREEG
ncbi:VOC family protein [Ornithinimicrobium sp. W1665]|uniref:VOC family protein n=1 Tax=Ornithinimicrobium sp. W1665 TaxID=3416666 RepID=UPI003CECFB63